MSAPNAETDLGPITHGRVWRIAGPMVISNATVPLVGIVDSAVVGQLGQAAPIGAVAVGASLLSAFYWLFGFLRMGTTGLTAQAAGQGDEGERTALLLRALIIGALAGLGLIAAQGLLFRAAFALSPASAEVQGLAEQYLAIRIWSAPALIASYGITGWLIAMERTRAVLALQITINGVNIALDLWFVLGLGWGVPGVAWATFAAEWAGLALGLWACRDGIASGAWRAPGLLWDRARMLRMAALNRDILLRSVLLLAVMLSFVVIYSPRFGDVALAGNQILMQFLSFTSFALDGLAFAAEVLVGQAFGAGARAQLRRALWITALWAALVAFGLAALFGLWGGPVIDVMTTSDPVRAAAREVLPWMVLCPLLAFPAYLLDGVFIGATRAGDMRNMMVVSAGLYFAAASVMIPLWGNHGLWAALLVCFVARAGSLAWRYPALERAL